VVHGHNDHEVDGGRDQQEIDDRRQQHAELDVIAVEGDDGEAVEVGRTHQTCDERHQHALDQCRYHGAKRGADDDCDGKVYDVALEYEVLEACQHGLHGNATLLTRRDSQVISRAWRDIHAGVLPQENREE
jgi:hypothetical protein